MADQTVSKKNMYKGLIKGIIKILKAYGIGKAITIDNQSLEYLKQVYVLLLEILSEIVTAENMKEFVSNCNAKIDEINKSYGSQHSR